MSQIPPHFRQALDEFLSWLTNEKGCSPHTIDS